MFIKSIDFSKYSSIKIGPTVEVMMIERGDNIPTDRYLVGGANNLLISPTPPPLMMLSKDFSTIELYDDILTIGASTPTGKIVSYAKRHNLSGFEFFAKLPGMLGGMLAMNAGVKQYEIFDILDSIEIDSEWVDVSQIEHGYRYASLGGVATRARFVVSSGYSQSLADELKALRANQPQKPSAGSAFKNPPNDHAGRLIEAVGLKGLSIGGMQWSPMHANFLVNNGNGTYNEAIELIELAKAKVSEEFDIILEEEIRILD